MITRTADRTLLIFELFAQRLEPLTLSELARALEMPVSTCSNLMRTLQARGYLYEVGGRKAFYPTARWLQKAQAITEADPVGELVQPSLRQLRDEVDETILLGKRMGDQIVYLSVVPGAQSIRYNGEVGDLKMMHSTSSGKAILGSMPLAERLTVISRLKLSRGTPDTITQRKQLLEDINLGARRGWWSTRGENVSDVMALAAPITLGPEVYTIVIAGPISRMEPRTEFLVKRLLAVCKKFK